MAEVKSIRHLTREIEQNLRTTERTIRTFIEFNEILLRAQNERNQVFFGRRGTGKTLLINNFLRNYSYTYHAKINIESFKTQKLSDAIINTLIRALQAYQRQMLARTERKLFITIYRPKASKMIDSAIKECQALLALPERFNISDTESENSQAALGLTQELINLKQSEASSRSRITSFDDTKLRKLYNLLPLLRDTLKAVADTVVSSKIYLSLDDFYFIPKAQQPYFLDFMHNLCKNTPTILKVSTIRHRSMLCIQAESFIGVELGADIQGIDLDYTLDSFPQLEEFLITLLQGYIDSSFAQSLTIEDLIEAKPLKLLVVASGGVPRDFLNYILKVCEKLIRNPDRPVGIKDILEIVSNNLVNKRESLVRDSGEDETQLLRHLDTITNEIIEVKKTNIFLIPNNLKEINASLDQSIKELADLRFLHHLSSRVDRNETHKYSAFLIDMCLYANLVRSRNFKYHDITSIGNPKKKFAQVPKLPMN